MGKFVNKIIILCAFILVGCKPLYDKHNSHYCSLKKAYSSTEVSLLDKNWANTTSLKGGLSHSTLNKVSTGEDSYVIRSIAHRNQKDKIREIYSQEIASEQDYGPKLYGYDVDSGKIIMSFLQGSKEQLDPSVKASKLADLLRSIHSEPNFCDHIPIIEKVKSVFAKVKDYFNDSEKQKFVSMIAELERVKQFKKTATHRDLNPNNIIFSDGKFRVIDFEDSGQDDPFFDIATIIVFNFENTPYEQRFLKHYFGRNPFQEEIAHLHAMKKLILLVYGFDLILKIPPQTISKTSRSMDFYKILEGVKKGQLSLENNEHLLILAKSMLSMAMELDNKNTKTKNNNFST